MGVLTTDEGILVSEQEEVLLLLKHYLKVIDSNKGQETSNRYIKGQGLIAKCFEHCASTEYLLRGTNLPEINVSFKDFGTVFVTARAALECMLTFGQVFFLPANERAFEYQLDVWVMSGLLDRQGFFPPENLIEINKQKLEAEKKEIEEIKSKIITNENFMKLTEGQRKNVLKGEWKSDGWVTMGVNVGFDESRIRSIYSYLCGQAHSGGLSGIQYNHLLSQREDPRPEEFILPLIAVVLANMINMFCGLFPKSKEVHEADQKAVEVVNLFLMFGRTSLEKFS